MTPEELLNLLETASFNARKYSGRRMYGKDCPAFTVESDGEIMLATLDIVRAADEMGVPNDQLHEALRNATTDSMGKGVVVYFPRYTFEVAR